MSTRSTTLTIPGSCLLTGSTSCWRSWRSLYSSRRAMLSHYCFFEGQALSTQEHRQQNSRSSEVLEKVQDLNAATKVTKIGYFRPLPLVASEIRPVASFVPDIGAYIHVSLPCIRQDSLSWASIHV